MLLPLSQPVLEAMNSIAQELGPLLRALLGQRPQLAEGPCAVTAHPGALRQQVHQDVDTTVDLLFHYSSGQGEEAVGQIVTVFLALQDITEEMGPTELFPGSHCFEVAESVAKRRRLMGKDASHEEWRRGYDQVFGWKPHLAILEIGDAMVMDTRVFHCGGANCSEVSRVLFHCSWVSGAGERPLGFTYHRHVPLQLCLSDLPLTPRRAAALLEEGLEHTSDGE